MKRKKIVNERTKKFSSAVKELARLRNSRPDIIHKYLKERFGYVSYGFLWKRQEEVLKFVTDLIKQTESNIYSK